MTETRTHAPLSASKASIWQPCPASKFFDWPEEDPGEAALEGTQMHEYCEIALGDFLRHKVEGTDPDIRTFNLIADPEKRQVALDYRDIVWKEVLFESITGKAYEIEDKLVLDESLGMWGFTDFWAIYIDDRAKRTGVICDFKYGFLSVDINANPQLAFYAVALQEEVRRLGKNLDHVRACIYQPRDPNGSPFKETWFSASQLESWKKKFYKAAEQIYVKKKPKFKVGPHCKWCPVSFKCPKYQKDLNTKTSLAIVDPKINLPLVETLPDETVAKLALRADEIETYLGKCKAHAIQRHLMGMPLPFVKVVEGKSRRKWIDDETFIIETLRDNGVVEATKPVLRNLTDIEKEVTKLYGKKQAESIMDPLCDKTKPPLKVVAAEDPRPSIAAGMEALPEGDQ